MQLLFSEISKQLDTIFLLHDFVYMIVVWDSKKQLIYEVNM